MNYTYDAQTKTLVLGHVTGTAVPTVRAILEWFDTSSLKDNGALRVAAEDKSMPGIIVRALLAEAINEGPVILEHFDRSLPLNVITADSPHSTVWRWGGACFVPEQNPPHHQYYPTGWGQPTNNDDMLISYITGMMEITISRVSARAYRINSARQVILHTNMGANRNDHLIPSGVVGLDREIINSTMAAWPEISSSPWVFVLPSGVRVSLQSANSDHARDEGARYTLKDLYDALTTPNKHDTILSKMVRSNIVVSDDGWIGKFRRTPFDEMVLVIELMQAGVQTVSEYNTLMEILDSMVAPEQTDG